MPEVTTPFLTYDTFADLSSGVSQKIVVISHLNIVVNSNITFGVTSGVTLSVSLVNPYPGNVEQQGMPRRRS